MGGAIHANSCETAGLQALPHPGERDGPIDINRSQQQQLCASLHLQDAVNDFIGGLFLRGNITVRAMNHTKARVQNSEIVINFRYRPDC